jgi:hypothetical protein
MPYFCVNQNAQSNGDHEVHELSVNCPFEPSAANQLALGYYTTCRGAVEAATKYFDQVNGCYFCANPCHTT